MTLDARPAGFAGPGPRRFVDAHVHFWDQSERHISWPMLDIGFRYPLHRFNEHGHYTAADHRAETAGAPITKVVHVQAAVVDDPAVETEWLQRMANSDPMGWPNGIVGSGSLCDERAPEMLDRHAQYANFRGVRDPMLTDYLEHPGVEVALNKMAALRAVCDLTVRLPRFDALAAVLDRHPDTVFVLNHGGSPVERTPAFLAAWRAGLREIARRPNLYCKVSGFGLHDHTWTPATLRPMVFDCIDAFGFERCLIASDWPVDKLYSTYLEMIATYDLLTQDCSESERDQLFAATAEHVYRI